MSNKWISKTPRPKNEVFICPNCNHEVNYIDKASRRKYIRKIAKCDYVFCGWCGEKVNDENERGNIE